MNSELKLFPTKCLHQATRENDFGTTNLPIFTEKCTPKGNSFPLPYISCKNWQVLFEGPYFYDFETDSYETLKIWHGKLIYKGFVQYIKKYIYIYKKYIKNR